MNEPHKKFCEEISIVYTINFFLTRCALGTRVTWAKFTKIELWRMVSAILSAGIIGVLAMSRSEVKVKCLQKAIEGFECCIYHLLVSYFLIISGGNGYTWSPIGAQERDSLGKRIEISKRSKNLVTLFLFVLSFFFTDWKHKNWVKFGTVWQWIQFVDGSVAHFFIK